MDTESKPPESAAPEKNPSKNEELVFRPSAEPSIGVEIELQILDRDTGDLAPGAVRILKACEEEKIEGVAAELMQSMIEVKTGICKNVDEVRDQLFARTRKVRNIASSLGFELAMGGTHPFHRTSTSTVYPAERYEKHPRSAGLADLSARHVRPARSRRHAVGRHGDRRDQPADAVCAAPDCGIGEFAVLARGGHGADVEPDRPCIACCRTRGCRSISATGRSFATTAR